MKKRGGDRKLEENRIRGQVHAENAELFVENSPILDRIRAPHCGSSSLLLFRASRRDRRRISLRTLFDKRR